MTCLSTEQVLAWFARLNETPRPSGREKALSDLLRRVAEERGCETWQDAHGNLLLRKAAAPGQEHRPGLVLQAHLDMVGACAPGVRHDFARDPIRIVRDGDQLTADGTTLGADDGIGVAVALCVLESDLAHPPLEVLLTVGEEVGLVGAKQLPPGLLQGSFLLNLDGEQEGVFLTSSAGGVTLDLDLDLGEQTPVDALTCLRLSGLRGGHSGLDIDDGRLSALVAVAEFLSRLAVDVPVQLAQVDAPGAFNAISREASVVFACAATDLNARIEAWQREVAAHEPGALITLERIGPGRAWSRTDSQRALMLLAGLPHGVHTLSPALAGLVESSSNVGVAASDGSRLHVTLSTRSSDQARQDELLTLIGEVAARADAQVHRSGEYPAWEFDADSPLLDQAVALYERLYGSAPRIEGVHGGLECGVLAATYPHLKLLSLGSQLHGCHTPEETASVASVGRLARLVAALVTELG